MPNEFTIYVARQTGATRLKREWVPTIEEAKRPAPYTGGGGGSNVGRLGPSTAGRVINDWSPRSRAEMRWVFSCLRWQDLGLRPAMVTLTYPGDWRAVAPNGPAVQTHVKRLKARWQHRWGEPIRGPWVREFQTRGAPHFHCYVGLPEAVTEEDYAELTARTIRRHKLQGMMSKWEARRSCGMLEGEFGDWLLRAWGESVGSEPRSHHRRQGADVAPMFWGATVKEAAEGRVNWARVANYLWHESGKWGQKTAPEGFEPVGRWWGVWGDVDLDIVEGQMSEGGAMEIRRPLDAVLTKQEQAERARRERRRGKA